jgi:hypothetical protein
VTRDAPPAPRRRTVPRKVRVPQQVQLAIPEPEPVVSLEVVRAGRAPGAAAAHRRWHDGLVVPWRITTALDIRELHGPQVDVDLGVEDPSVDMWEAGILYPTWDEMLRLAVLTDFPVAFFTETPGRPVRAVDTSLRFHARLDDVDEREPVLAFPPNVVAATMADLGLCASCHGPR